MAILSGKIAFKLDQDRELILKAGDTLIQGGNLHTWSIAGASPACCCSWS